MSWGGGWDQSRCEAVDANGVRCALAPAHNGEHRTEAGIAETQRSAWLWRVLIGAGLAALLFYLVYGIPGVAGT